MSDPFIGEIRIFAFDSAPSGWAMCNGQLLPISQNTALFSVIGTTYGGDGQNNFALPNLQGRFPIHVGQGPDQASYAPGQEGGAETVALQTSEMPMHNHMFAAYLDAPNSGKPGGNVLAGASIYVHNQQPDGNLSAATIVPAGEGQPHENIPPYLALNFCIALQGTDPS